MVPQVHAASYATTFYPRSTHAYKIRWTCACGKSGGITDGRIGATLKRARSAFARHAAHSA